MDTCFKAPPFRMRRILAAMSFAQFRAACVTSDGSIAALFDSLYDLGVRKMGTVEECEPNGSERVLLLFSC
jgi:hypothetical protein